MWCGASLSDPQPLMLSLSRIPNMAPERDTDRETLSLGCKMGGCWFGREKKVRKYIQRPGEINSIVCNRYVSCILHAFIQILKHRKTMLCYCFWFPFVLFVWLCKSPINGPIAMTSYSWEKLPVWHQWEYMVNRNLHCKMCKILFSFVFIITVQQNQLCARSRVSIYLTNYVPLMLVSFKQVWKHLQFDTSEFAKSLGLKPIQRTRKQSTRERDWKVRRLRKEERKKPGGR